MASVSLQFTGKAGQFRQSISSMDTALQTIEADICSLCHSELWVASFRRGQSVGLRLRYRKRCVFYRSL